MNASRIPLAIPTNNQVGPIKMTPAQLNDVTNIASNSSCKTRKTFFENQ